MIQDYLKAKRLGERAYRRAVLKGQFPYLPSLDEMVEDIESFPEISLGTAEIPLDRIVGTRRKGRQNAFAANFMPLMEERSEFAVKWSKLYEAQINEGIRDPIKVYEFVNRFYVEEGNKRVSVLRYVGAVSIAANIIRIKPPRMDNDQSRLYYEYLDFYKVTKSFEIVLSAPGRYGQLARILEQNLQDPWPRDLLDKLHRCFIVFQGVYRKKGGGRLTLTDGDAFLIYLSFFSLDSLLREGREEIGRRILRLWREFIAAASPEGIALIEKKEEAEKKAEVTPIRKAAKIVEKTVEMTGAAGFSPSNPLRIAFLHESDALRSGRVYSHILGANHLKEAFGSRVDLVHFENCGTQAATQEALAEAAERGCRMIFATSPSMTRDVLRFAVDHPEIRVLNCSYNQMNHAVRFYYGKMYEAKFLMGALAASVSDEHRIGYIAGRNDPASIANINAFALGAQLIDPRCRIDLRWLPGYTEEGTAEEGEPETGGGDRTGPQTGAGPAAGSAADHGKVLDSLLRKGKIHVISDLDVIRTGEKDRKYGLYLCSESGDIKRLAAPLSNWGVFYEIVVKKMLEGDYDDVSPDQKNRAMNYWLGISSGLIDVILSDELPEASRRLVNVLRRGITEEIIQPFEGMSVRRNGAPGGPEEKTPSNAEIMSMDRLADNVDEEEEEESARG